MEWNFENICNAFQDAIEATEPASGISDISFIHEFGNEQSWEFESPEIADVIIDVPGYPIADPEQDIENLSELTELIRDCILADMELPEGFGLKLEVKEIPGRVTCNTEWTFRMGLRHPD